MTEYFFSSTFNMICNCKSFYNMVPINTFISVRLKNNDYTIKFLQKCKTKPTEYDILLYDLYNHDYWVYDANVTNHLYTRDIIEKLIINYVEENIKVLKLCFFEMKFYLLDKLNNVDVFLFYHMFIDFYRTTVEEKNYITKYYDQFIRTLDDIILYSEMNNIARIKIGNYILQHHEDFFNELLNDYCTCQVNEETIIDAYYIITSLNILIK